MRSVREGGRVFVIMFGIKHLNIEGERYSRDDSVAYFK